MQVKMVFVKDETDHGLGKVCGQETDVMFDE